MINRREFQKFFNNPVAEKYNAYKKVSKKYNLEQHIHFLSQIAHESGKLRRNKESHLYSAKRIKQIFPKYFKNKSDRFIKLYYERKSRLLDLVYQNRMGNGSELSKDGSRFRGRGYIQLTGANNYRFFGLYKFPHRLLEEATNWDVCFQYWIKNGFDKIAYSSLTEEQAVRKVTRKLNGGYNGLKDRTKLFLELKEITS